MKRIAHPDFLMPRAPHLRLAELWLAALGAASLALFFFALLALPSRAVETGERPRGLGGAVALDWLVSGAGGSLLAGDGAAWPGAWPGSGGAGLHLAAAAPPPAPLGAASGLTPEEAEDQRARLGAAFLAEVMGPRPRRAAALGKGAEGLRNLVASVEAGKAGYDAVVYGAKVPPPAPPSQMTLAAIRHWTAATPGQNHALGRYQIVPRTLKDLTTRLALPETTVFSPRIQDQMADLLIADAGYHEFRAGRLSRRAFMENLAVIWAALPRSDGLSAYHGINGNRAGMSWEAYQTAMRQIFPE